jgi:hypothetical protein
MPIPIAFLLVLITVSASALEWKSELFHCTANLPDSTGWQAVESPPASGLTTLVVMQNLGRQAVFGINVVEDLPGTNVTDPAVRQRLENMLRQFTYQFNGHSTVKVGDQDWLQYPVRSGSGAQRVSGVIRFASAGGYVFGITMLKGGGQDAASDMELQQAAASFRVQPAIASATQPAQPPTTQTLAATPAAPTARLSDKDKNNPGSATEEPSADSGSNLRLVWYAGAGLVVLVVFFSIIGGDKAGKR